MNPLSLYEFSVPVFLRGLDSLSGMLDKGAAHAAAKKYDPAILVQARLFPDMYPLARQVQIACDTVKGAAGRLAGVDIPKHDDTESTFEELKQRIGKTTDFLKSVQAAQMSGAESRTIELRFPSGAMKFTGASYLTGFVLPNFYFHSSMVYALLRQSGVELGKSDFLGALPQ